VWPVERPGDIVEFFPEVLERRLEHIDTGYRQKTWKKVRVSGF